MGIEPKQLCYDMSYIIVITTFRENDYFYDNDRILDVFQE